MESKQRLLRAAMAVFTTITLLMLLLPFTNSAALASSVEPRKVTGNPTCGDFTDGGTEFKIDDPSELTPADSGIYTDGAVVVDLEIYETDMGPAFDWSSNFGVDVVVVKGGPEANVYRYDPIATVDAELHSPFNPRSDKWYGLSHISFCYSPGNETATTEALVTTTTTRQTTTTALGTTSSVAASQATSTSIRAEVLPTQLTTSTTAAELLGAEELPFTGMSTARMWVLSLSLLGAGTAALIMARGAEDS